MVSVRVVGCIAVGLAAGLAFIQRSEWRLAAIWLIGLGKLRSSERDEEAALDGTEDTSQEGASA